MPSDNFMPLDEIQNTVFYRNLVEVHKKRTFEKNSMFAMEAPNLKEGIEVFVRAYARASVTFFEFLAKRKYAD